MRNVRLILHDMMPAARYQTIGTRIKGRHMTDQSRASTEVQLRYGVQAVCSAALQTLVLTLTLESLDEGVIQKPLQ